MRTNWVAAAVGVGLAVAAGLSRAGPERPPAMDELINQSDRGGQIGQDRRPAWQQWVDPVAWWFERYPRVPSHETPERLHGGIM